MTSVSARPMATPDLAGLLSKPRRRPAPPSVEEPTPIAAGGGGDNSEPDDGDIAEQSNESAADEPTDSLVPDEIAEPDLEHPPAEQTAPAKPRRTRQTRQELPRADEPTAAPVRQYLQLKAFNLPRSLHRRLSERAAADKVTQTSLILTAVNRTHGQLAGWLEADARGAGAAGDLFDVPQAKTDREPPVQTTCRLTDRQVEAIEGLAGQLGTNRSRLITAALTLYLS